MISLKIEQNENYSAVVLSFFFLVFCAFLFFVSPVHADLWDGANQPLGYFGGGDLQTALINQGYPVKHDARSSVTYEIRAFNNTVGSDLYIFYATSNGNCYYASTTPNTNFYVGSVKINNSTLVESFNGDLDSVTLGSSPSYTNDDITIYYQSRGNYSANYRVACIPFYETLEDGLLSLATHLQSATPSASVYPLGTSYLAYDTGSYIRASMPDVAGIAYWSDDSGQTLHMTVATIDPDCFITRSTDSASSPVTLYRSLDPDNCYYATVSSVSQDLLSIGYFSSQNDAVEAIYDYLVDNGGTPVAYSAHSLTYDLPAGNAIFLDVTGVVGSFSLDTTSSTSVSVSEFNSNDNRAVGYVDALPDTFSIPYPGLSDVVWDASGSPNLMGRYQHFSASSGYAQGNHKYLVIVNPTYDNLSVQNGTLQSDNPAATNGYLTINARCNNFYIVALSASVSLEDGNFVLDGESSGKRYNGTFDDTTGQPVITDSETGQPSSPVIGGQNNIGGDTSEERFTSFVDWLKNTLKGIGESLNVGKNAIVNLVSYASGFFSAIGQLYTWLPTPIYSVLCSAVVLVITVGIIKVFI